MASEQPHEDALGQDEARRRFMAGLPRAGDVLAGRWRLTKLLGTGGMGVVYAGAHEVTGRRVALKFLYPGVAKNQRGLGRFLREAKVGGLADHPGIARVLDFATSPEGTPYLVMEYVDGEPLDRLVEADPPRPTGEMLAYLINTLDTLAFIHDRGIVHRDLKPANIFCDTANPPRTWVLDFGVARASKKDLGLQDVTLQGMAVGTPLYMSPEQARADERIGPGADLWAVGITLFRVLTGRLPFEGETRADVIASVLTDDAPRPTRVRPGLPAEADRIVARALAKDPKRRYGDAATMAGDLRRLGATLPGGELMSAAPARVPGRGVLWPGRARRSLVLAIGLLLVAGLAGLVTYLAVRPDAGTKADASSSAEAAAAAAAGGSLHDDALTGGPLGGAENGDPAALRMVWVVAGDRDALRAEIEEIRRVYTDATGRPIELVIPRSYDEAVGMVLRDAVDFGTLPPASYAFAKARDPKMVLLARQVLEGSETYRALLVVASGSPLVATSDIAGHPFCLVDPASTSGYLYPRAMLRAAGVDPDKALGQVQFAGSHWEALERLKSGRCEAAAVASGELESWRKARGLGDRGFRVRILARSEPIPGDAFIARHDLDQDLLAGLTRGTQTLIERTKVAAGAGELGSIGFAAGEDGDYDRIRKLTGSRP